MEVQHFFHDHPLTLTPYRTYDRINPRCCGCGEVILGISYRCRRCRFFLHKTCGQQPRELQHPLHPQHPLLLLRECPNHDRCYFCNEFILSGFAYSCSHCKFNLHLICASYPFTVKAEFHDHPLNLLRKSLSFTCDACGVKDKDVSYLCLTCPLMVHLKCATLPLTVKHTGHHHALNLTDSSHQLDHRICHLCVTKVETDRVYYCSKCNFVAHLDCATREGYTEEIKNEDPELDESIDSLAYVVSKIKIGGNNIEIAEEIKHLSHVHDLKLTEDQLLNNEKCDGCMHPIFPDSSFYSCAQCRFFLHKTCVELPRKKQHPLHPHLLTLLTKAPYVLSGFICNVCGRTCDGFTYHCEKCEFDADVQCSLISDIFAHDSHKHTIYLSRAPYMEKCTCCDYEGKVFRCADCEFNLDLRCATLPLTMRYRHFEEPFKLCYKDEGDSNYEYYCDVCEEKRNPKHLFYYCAALCFSAHPKCVLGESP
ncbi:uncharacterized protein LOC132168944 [Corylus avellana]|uniref:uncharacterized protein LOC132168944 n=1 Tax=Corylus avellana TaxID=13451 RepID=UPI00286C510C|nr:uncharacterized protein LOC132168944 [Corylus avellana]